MARIEKVGKRSYAKVPNRVEKELIDLVNKYFKSTAFDPETGAVNEVVKEEVINEVVARMYPVIYNLSAEVANNITQEAIAQLLETIPSMEDYLSNFDYVRYSFIMDETHPTDRIVIPVDKIMFIDRGSITVTVNGMEQIKNVNYTLVPRIDNELLIDYIYFEADALEAPDVIGVNYSFMEVGTN